MQLLFLRAINTSALGAIDHSFNLNNDMTGRKKDLIRNFFITLPNRLGKAVPIVKCKKCAKTFGGTVHK